MMPNKTDTISNAYLSDVIAPKPFYTRLLAWQAAHGRHDLPWQNQAGNPYAVWISEIMLQQTQVAQVIPYYTRFMQKFVNLDALADAKLDDVLAHWAGLGYYARAKNLHKGAKMLQQMVQKDGYPKTQQEWQQISGVGKSTAGAIVAMGMGGYGVICDGNVKRVLARVFNIDAPINTAGTETLLWDLAAKLTPAQNSGQYAQAMMDLGATVCRKTRPDCSACPMVDICQAYAHNTVHTLPKKKPKTPKKVYRSYALVLVHDGKILHLKRMQNIWQNLWCLPLYAHGDDQNMTDCNVHTVGASNYDIHDKNHVSIEDNIVRYLHAKNALPYDAKPPICHILTHVKWYFYAQHIPVKTADVANINRLLDKDGTPYAWLDKNTQNARPKWVFKLLT